MGSTATLANTAAQAATSDGSSVSDLKNTKKQKFNRNSHFEQWGQIDCKLENLRALTQEPAPKKNCPRTVKPSSASDFKWGSDGQYFFSFLFKLRLLKLNNATPVNHVCVPVLRG